MKNRFLLLALLFLNFGMSQTQSAAYAVRQDNVAANLRALTSDEMEGREAGTPGIEKAAVLLENYFKQINIQPYFKTYRDTLTTFARPTCNIVGYIEGNDPVLKNQFIILGGHYDHIGMTYGNANTDRINNGANDDASGVTAVLEIARFFSQSKSNKRSLLFVCFSGEEKGLLGSKSLAKKLKAQKIDLYTMLNFEMIGVPMNRDYTAYITGFDKSNMAAKINEYAGTKVVGYLEAEKSYQLFSRSDNYSFYKEFHIPSQTVCTFDFENYEFYHQPGDEFEEMDIPHMTSFIQTMIPVIEKMANASTKEIKIN
ncbi:MAG: peptidase M28 [Flavobacterium sp. BFFFF1]|uniref:M28 family metallopeptidase n=1 Tax=Flavobacterium sp. BFFFF1 TaxID=2015557 RepID=UPI000BDA360F|nr:M28 family peptidase [Flavobacterium sp. BFFFF1]OYU79541.1 MAG: peptidase M28 [Flavobacterium sp. BFFFF1]